MRSLGDSVVLGNKKAALWASPSLAAYSFSSAVLVVFVGIVTNPQTRFTWNFNACKVNLYICQELFRLKPSRTSFYAAEQSCLISPKRLKQTSSFIQLRMLKNMWKSWGALHFMSSRGFFTFKVCQKSFGFQITSLQCDSFFLCDITTVAFHHV